MLAQKKHRSAQEASTDLAMSRQTVFASSHLHPVIKLQRTIGNHAVQRLLHAKAEGAKGSLGASASACFALDARHNLESRVQSARGSGQPLPRSERDIFEPRFGYGLSQDKIHTDANATPLNRETKARVIPTSKDKLSQKREGSFTISEGKKVLAHGVTHTDLQMDVPQIRPRTSLQLLDHELTHVVQQGAHRSVIHRRLLPPSTNYAFDTYNVTEADLSDSDIVARFQSLSLTHLIQYRNRVTDPAVIAYIVQLLSGRLNAMTLDQLFAYLASENDPTVRSYIDQWLTNHAPTSYEIALGANKPGTTEVNMKASGISVKVLPDEFVDEVTFKSTAEKVTYGVVTPNTKAITVYTPLYRPRWLSLHGRVTSVKPTIQELRIKTVYLRGTSRITKSGYGVGTREQEDKPRGRITLAHHEGSHAVCFIQYVTDKAPPTFTGKIGDTDTQVHNKDQTFKTAMAKYYADMGALCGPAVDCTGTKANFCPP